MKYQNVVVLGIDQFAAFCAKKVNEFDYNAQVIDTNDTPNSMLFSACKRLGVQYEYLKRDERTNYLHEILKKLLIISATNPWIIPDSIITEEGISAINLHHALLPRHQGRNAEAWAIFEGDNEAGITWHFMSSTVDAGDIIIQAETAIDEFTTSRKLLKILSNLAKETFEKIYEDVLNDDVKSYSQSLLHPKVHYSWEVPNNGLLDHKWDFRQISCFLRAMDYGLLKTLGDPRIVIQNESYTWTTYEISDNIMPNANKIERVGNDIIIFKNDKLFKLKNIYRIDAKMINN